MAIKFTRVVGQLKYDYEGMKEYLRAKEGLDDAQMQSKATVETLLFSDASDLLAAAMPVIDRIRAKSEVAALTLERALTASLGTDKDGNIIPNPAFAASIGQQRDFIRTEVLGWPGKAEAIEWCKANGVAIAGKVKGETGTKPARVEEDC